MSDTDRPDDTAPPAETTDGAAAEADPGAGREPDNDAAEAEPTRKARSEAAGYRRRLRDTEAERDTLAAERDQLRTQLDDRTRADVEALAGQRLLDGSDLWTATTLADLLDDQGDVDPALVTQAVDQLAKSKPHYVRSAPSFDLGHRGESVKGEATFADVLRGGRT